MRIEKKEVNDKIVVMINDDNYKDNNNYNYDNYHNGSSYYHLIKSYYCGDYYHYHYFGYCYFHNLMSSLLFLISIRQSLLSLSLTLNV